MCSILFVQIFGIHKYLLATSCGCIPPYNYYIKCRIHKTNDTIINIHHSASQMHIDVISANIERLFPKLGLNIQQQIRM